MAVTLPTPGIALTAVLGRLAQGLESRAAFRFDLQREDHAALGDPQVGDHAEVHDTGAAFLVDDREEGVQDLFFGDVRQCIGLLMRLR